MGSPTCGDKSGVSLAGRFFSKVVLCFTHRCSAAMRFSVTLSQAHGRSFVSPGRGEGGCTEVARDRTETRRKLKVAGGLVARYEPDDSELPPFLGSCRVSLRNRRSWRVLAGANRRDCPVRIPNRFCRSFHLPRKDGIASQIVARDPFGSDGYLSGVSVADRQEI